MLDLYLETSCCLSCFSLFFSRRRLDGYISRIKLPYGSQGLRSEHVVVVLTRLLGYGHQGGPVHIYRPNYDVLPLFGTCSSMLRLKETNGVSKPRIYKPWMFLDVELLETTIFFWFKKSHHWFCQAQLWWLRASFRQGSQLQRN